MAIATLGVKFLSGSEVNSDERGNLGVYYLHAATRAAISRSRDFLHFPLRETKLRLIAYLYSQPLKQRR